MQKSRQIALLLIIAVVASTVAASQTFTQACADPSFPSKATSIDSACDVAGRGGKEAAQNEAKNNFCAQGEPEPTSFEQLKRLQVQVNNAHSIPFGRTGMATRRPGPATHREALQRIGEGKLVVLKAFVLKARQEGAESVNCGKPPQPGAVPDEPGNHDIHISVVPTGTENDECNGIVAEMSPHHRPPEWTAENVNKLSQSHTPVRVTGQLLFDSSHSPCQNGQISSGDPKRFSLWEIHPIYKFEVCTGDCGGTGTWTPLEEWATKH